MGLRFLPSNNVRALAIVYVLIAAAFVFVVQAQSVSAQAQRTELVVGLQNDMTSMNYFDPATNTVWKYYMVAWGFESLLFHDPSYQSFPFLADPAYGGGAGYTIDATGLNVTVQIRSGVTFHNGDPLTVDDVIFTYQTLAWSTYAIYITDALWWDTPKYPLWNSTTYGGTCTFGGQPCLSHVGVEKGVQANQVVFHLTKPYALFFYLTMEIPILPKNIWRNHIDPAPPVNPLNPRRYVTDSFDRSIDFGYGTQPGQYDATIGTGMFKFDYWNRERESHISYYTGYWGTTASHTWQGVEYPFQPRYLRSIKFIIYTSLDVISLALQKGEIDTLIWSLTPGFLTQVRANPAISVEQVTDAGYFYIAFNLRRYPWNNLTLRQAISMAIDKDYIVKTLMGGFGIKGTVPIAITNPAYINTSANPPDFDLARAQQILDAANIRVDPATGFRRMPDGTPIKASILTPPKDYDPVRADAGIMISNNLKKIGLDIDAAPTSFDAIVAKAFVPPVDFDIYILGWLLGDFPESYICSFFCSNQDVNVNKAGSNSAGYHNPEVDSLIAQALVTIDNTARQKLIKDVEGIVVRDLPWNVLYYRKNLNAYRNDAWVGWVNTPPQLYNYWSVVSIRPAGTPQPQPSTGTLQVALTIPDQVLARSTVDFDVYVSQANAPAAGASVVANVTYGTTVFDLTGTTDALGKASFSWPVPLIQGNVIVKVTATKGTFSGVNTKILEVSIGPPPPIYTLFLSTDKPVVHPGDTTTILATVLDGEGNPYPGAKLTIDRTLLLGTVNPASAGSDTTNATGVASFTYTAPPNPDKFPNQHLLEILKANVSIPNSIVVDTQSAALTLFVQNDEPPAWYITSIVLPRPLLPINDFVLRPPADTSTTIDVRVTDFVGNPLAGVDVDPVYDDAANITVSPATAGSNKTDATGTASFLVEETPGAIAGENITNVLLRFVPRNIPNAVSDQVALLLTNATLSPPGYAALLAVTTRSMPFVETGAENNVTAMVWDQDGLPASGVGVIFQITYGDLGLPAQFNWAMDYGKPEYLGEGLDLNSFGQGSLGGSFQNSTGQGAGYGVENFIEDYEVINDFDNLATGTTIDSCDRSTWPAGFEGLYRINATSVTDATGQFSAFFRALPHKLDSPIQVRAYLGPVPDMHVAVDACSYVASIVNATFRIDTGVVAQRAPVFALGSVRYSASILKSTSPTVTFTAQFYSVNGVPASDVAVILTQGAGSAARNVRGAFGGPIQADPEGVVKYTRTVSIVSLSQAFSFAFIPADSRYAYGGTDQLFAGDWGMYWFAPTFAALIAKVPYEFKIGYMFVPTTLAFLKVSTDQGLVAPGSNVTATVTVYSILTGEPIAGATVWSGSYQNVTDATGVATLTIPQIVLGATENLVVAATPYGGSGRAWYGVVTSNPVLTYSALSISVKEVGQASTINVTVTNTLPIAGTVTVFLSVDNVTVAAKEVSIGASESKLVSFVYTFATAGSHYVSVGTEAQAVSVPAPPAPVAADITLAVALLVVGLVIGAIVGLLLGRRGKKPEVAPEGPPPEAKPPEEESKGGEEL